MTEEQFENCKKCLNRKRGVNGKDNICNLRGNNLEFENDCRDFDLDMSSRIRTVIGSKNSVVKPNEKRAKTAQLFVLIVMLLDIVSIYSSYLQYGLLTALQNEENISDQIIDSNDEREALIGMVYIVVSIISIVTFIQWFRRAYYNLNIRMNCKHTEGWAAGSWFVPIISLYRPYQIMKEMWEGTSEMIKSKIGDYSGGSSMVIGFWWTLWIISNYIGQYVLKSAFKADTVEDYMNSTVADMVLSTIGIPLAIVTIIMIKSYAKKEEQITELEKDLIK